MKRIRNMFKKYYAQSVMRKLLSAVRPQQGDYPYVHDYMLQMGRLFERKPPVGILKTNNKRER